MRIRKKYGDKNQVGRTIVALREKNEWKQKDLLARLQVEGVDITTQSLSRLEGQERPATDTELRALARIFKVPMEQLFNQEES